MAVMPRTRRLIGARGTTFLRAHATTPKCCPSRASFFTAQYVHNHHVTSNNMPGRLRQERTVQSALQERGYRTAIFGKYLNAWPVSVDPPFFDDWAIMSGAYGKTTWNDHGRVGRQGRYTTDLISDRTVGFIRAAEREDDDQPWLAWVTPYAPHLPGTPARRHRGSRLPRFPLTPAMSELDFSDKPDFLDTARGSPEQIQTARDEGRRSLRAVDEMVARLVDELKRRDELADTLLVFTSDNGLLQGEHGGLIGKDLPYLASSQIPLLARWKGRFRPGTVRRDLVSNVDVATTILRAAGVERATDGKSLLSKQRRERLFLEHFGARKARTGRELPPWRSLRTRDFHYTEYRKQNGDLLFREYYDLHEDPWELENVVDALGQARIDELARSLRVLSRCKTRSCP